MAVAHVFQMMAGTSYCDHPSINGQVSQTLVASIPEIEKEADRLVPPPFFDANSPGSLACNCPVCGSHRLSTLAELGAQFQNSDEDQDDERKPDVRIGITGIVLPDHFQLARWFKVPTPPKFLKSRLHKKAKREGKQFGFVTFFSTLSFESVFFNPTLITMAIALIASLVAAFQGWSGLNKLAVEEDKGVAMELTVRKKAFRARNSAWDKLYYCSECGMVHDREGQQSLPWYSMLLFVHYPEQEFSVLESPVETRVARVRQPA